MWCLDKKQFFLSSRMNIYISTTEIFAHLWNFIYTNYAINAISWYDINILDSVIVAFYFLLFCNLIKYNLASRYCVVLRSCHGMINISLIFISSDGIIYPAENAFIWKLLIDIKQYTIINMLLYFHSVCVLHAALHAPTCSWVWHSVY